LDRCSSTNAFNDASSNDIPTSLLSRSAMRSSFDARHSVNVPMMDSH
jgi:hypothetical protein